MMNKEYNEMTFDLTVPEEKEQGMEFLNQLISYNAQKFDYYNDINIKQEENLMILRWVQVPFDGEWGGNFEYVGEDKYVMLRKTFPDGHFDYFTDEEEWEDVLSDWLKDNSTWSQDDWGNWREEVTHKNETLN